MFKNSAEIKEIQQTVVVNQFFKWNFSLFEERVRLHNFLISRDIYALQLRTAPIFPQNQAQNFQIVAIQVCVLHM